MLWRDADHVGPTLVPRLREAFGFVGRYLSGASPLEPSDETRSAEERGLREALAPAREAAGALLHDLQLFDVYRGQGIDSGKKSLSLGLIFQVASSTLTDDEVEAAMTRVLATLAERVGGVLRN